MTEKFLDRVYNEYTPEKTKALYDDWAQTYDAEVGDNGYATPGRVADALMRYLPGPDTPVLDFGCGTGLSGAALRLAGVITIDGMDPSPEMIDIAREKQIYRDLKLINVNDPMPIEHNVYSAITAIGVIGIGAAPPQTFFTLMKALKRRGVLALSLNDHALKDPAYEAALNQWLDCGAACLRLKEYGTHLPGQDLKSTVYIIEKN